MKALVLEGRVAQVEATAFPVAPELKWIDIEGVAPQPEPGWTYDGGNFAPPEEPGIDLDPDSGTDDELNSGLEVLKGSGASIDDLIDVLTGKGGKVRVAGRKK